MQQFTVPQFIDTEDKIIGPLTVRQFLIMLVCAIFIAIFYKIFDFSLFLTSSIILFALCGILAFAKINGRPFHYFILNFIQTIKKPGLRIWNNQNKIILEEVLEDHAKIDYVPASPKEAPASRLSELALIVDTAGTYGGEKK